MSTPHDVTKYPTDHLYRRTPEDTSDRVLDEVKDSREGYRQTKETSYSQYRTLALGEAQVFTPEIDGFDPADHEAGTGTFSVEIIGTNFTWDTLVNWDGEVMDPMVLDTEHLTVEVPVNSTAEGVPVFVTNYTQDSKVRNYRFTEPAEDPE